MRTGTHGDLATVRRLRADLAHQIARSLRARGIKQSQASVDLGVPQPTLSKIFNGRIEGLSLELLIRIAVRAGLSVVLQTGSDPREAGVHMKDPTNDDAGPRSAVADDARQSLTVGIRQMTPEERLTAFLEHSRLVASLRDAGRHQRSNKR